MKPRIALSLLIALMTFYSQRANAQQSKPAEELPKIEVGIESSTLLYGSIEARPGAGARLTYNLNRHFAVEGAAYFSAGCNYCGGETTGAITQGMFGVKVGQRFKKIGLFVKARPGVINLSQGSFDLVPTGSSQPLLAGSFEVPFRYVTHSRTDFALDVGPVLEIYPTKKFFVRIDTGLLIERVGDRSYNNYQFDLTTGSFRPLRTTIPGSNIGRVQLTTGVGFRF